MHGNVAEWCHDWYDKDYYKQSPRQDPQGPEKSTGRAERGCLNGCKDVEQGMRTFAWPIEDIVAHPDLYLEHAQ